MSTGSASTDKAPMTVSPSTAGLIGLILSILSALLTNYMKGSTTPSLPPATITASPSPATSPTQHLSLSVAPALPVPLAAPKLPPAGLFLTIVDDTGKPTSAAPNLEGYIAKAGPNSLIVQNYDGQVVSMGKLPDSAAELVTLLKRLRGP